MEESLLTHGLFPGGQGREDAGFGASHGRGVGIPVLVPSGCIWTAQRNAVQKREPESQQQHGCVHTARCSSYDAAWARRQCSRIQRRLRHSHAGGSAPCCVLYLVIAMNHATNGFHGDIVDLYQHICEQCLSLCLEKKGENILIVLTLVWVIH